VCEIVECYECVGYMEYGRVSTIFLLVACLAIGLLSYVVSSEFFFYLMVFVFVCFVGW